tara:strand:- start:2760 stop:3275 length:516 start_codon:yes stop_codon:yes gene_type:complete
MNKFLVAIMTCLLVVGCAERVDERSGISVELVPVTYTFKANVQKDNQPEVGERIREYLELHRDKVLTEQVFFAWSSKLAKQQVLETKEKLLLMGIDPKSIHISELTSSAQPFNLTISLQQFQVLVPTCEAPKVNRFGFTAHDCFVEGMRWQSMQHPEKMVGNQAKPSDVEK